MDAVPALAEPAAATAVKVFVEQPARLTSFDADSVWKLMADYVFNRQLALQLNVKPSGVYFRMRRKGIKPSAGRARDRARPVRPMS